MRRVWRNLDRIDEREFPLREDLVGKVRWRETNEQMEMVDFELDLK